MTKKEHLTLHVESAFDPYGQNTALCSGLHVKVYTTPTTCILACVTQLFVLPSEARQLHVSRFWLSHVLFYWVNPLMAQGSQRQLQASDLFALPAKLQPSTCSQTLWTRWASVRPIPMNACACMEANRVHTPDVGVSVILSYDPTCLQP